MSDLLLILLGIWLAMLPFVWRAVAVETRLEELRRRRVVQQRKEVA